MNKEQAESKIEQFEIKFNSTIEAFKLELNRIKAQLAEKPMLRHGDYGIGVDGFIHLEKETYWLGTSKTFPESGVSGGTDDMFVNDVKGNLVDDLRALAEPVEAMVIDRISIKLDEDGHLHINQDGEDIVIVSKSEIAKFIMNLRRIMLPK